jgi:hypothetical protein
VTPDSVTRLAEKIYQLVRDNWATNNEALTRIRMVEEIESLLREAMDAAINADRKIWDAQHDSDLKIQVKEAYTRAAEVARSCCPKSGSYRSLGEDIAAAIEKLKENK